MTFAVLVLLLVGMVSSVDSIRLGLRGSAVVTHEAFFDMSIGRKSIGKITIGLFGELAPKTVENFLHFTTQKAGKGYKGSVIHRVIPGHNLLAGDFIHGNGTGEASKFGLDFEDESFVLKHSGAGWLGMANRGRDTNTCIFYITFMEIPHLDGKHVVFGKVVDGMDVVREIENVETDDNDRPNQEVKITNCGEIRVNEPFRISTKTGSDEL
ncbi:peptidyl-prolyl cis-trans isomerase 6-like [Amphiura filiformis]|uniref:peptidyl-prolyl cis-trans isomerase 6-like n=1 Tax=Amphiura filiformis TaxID=82378 RepID=UPI003B2249A5